MTDKPICIYFNLCIFYLLDINTSCNYLHFFLHPDQCTKCIQSKLWHALLSIIMTLELGVSTAYDSKYKSLSLYFFVTPFFRYWRAILAWSNNRLGIWTFMNTLATVYSMKLACRHLNSASPKLLAKQLNSLPIWRQRISSWRPKSSLVAEEKDTSKERVLAEWRCVKRNYSPFD